MAHRRAAEDFLLSSLTTVPAQPADCPASSSFRLARTAAKAARPVLHDLMRIALQRHLALAFNPFLSSTSVTRLHSAALLWLKLCVLEDRLARLRALAEGGPDCADLLVKVRATIKQTELGSTVHLGQCQ